MVKSELVKRSPLRILERSTHGGVGKGNVGVFAGPKGVGKTACLVHIATDRLLQGKHIVHVSFSDDTSHIEAWYEDIFKELATRHRLDGAMEVHDSIIKNRIITRFEHDAAQWTKVENTIRSLMENADFSADTVVIDGYGFPPTDVDAFAAFKAFAAEVGLEIWFSASVKELEIEGNSAIPPRLKPYHDECAVVVGLVDKGNYIHLELIKDHGNPVEAVHLKLDPRILLIAEED